MPKGISIVVCIVVLENIFTDDGCKVDHQSTENFIIGIFINPKLL